MSYRLVHTECWTADNNYECELFDLGVEFDSLEKAVAYMKKEDVGPEYYTLIDENDKRIPFTFL